jgi:hypothetical protein
MGVKPNNSKANKNRIPVSKYTYTVRVLFMKPTRIDEHVFAETAILDYSLSRADQGKKLPFPVSVCSKQTEVCRFHFPFAANKRKLPFSVGSVAVCSDNVYNFKVHM